MEPNANGASPKKHWILGISVALVGVILARLVCPEIDANGLRFAVMIFGHFLCLFGLFIIAHGVFKRHQSDQ